MNPKLAEFLVRLYPASWRNRYGSEFQTFLESGPGGLRSTVNVVWSALRERMLPTFASPLHRRAALNQFRLWCIHRPWAVFTLGPILTLAVSYFVALFMLWLGWQVFLPGSDSPFGHPTSGPIYGLENLYFQADRFFYFTAPVLVGWAISFVAAHPRIKSAWPITGLVLVTLAGATNQVHASRTAVYRGFGHISMDFALGNSVPAVYDHLSYAAILLCIAATPYLVWRISNARSVSA